eukprot:768448-Hanusia_phi.AAC.1
MSGDKQQACLRRLLPVPSGPWIQPSTPSLITSSSSFSPSLLQRPRCRHAKGTSMDPHPRSMPLTVQEARV